MKEKWKNIAVLFIAGGYILVFLILQLLLPSKDMSDTERRALKQLPELSAKTVSDGSFMKDFETYTQDQFPLRDTFRGIKAAGSLALFSQKEVNKLYVKDGYISKVEYPFSEEMVEYATERFQKIYDSFLKDTEVTIYGSIVPDKNYYLAEESGHLKLDYEALTDCFCRNTPYMTYVSINDLLSLEDYYRTDTHWKQEAILPVAERLCQAMKNPLPPEYLDLEKTYVKQILDSPFYGVYWGQLSLPVSPDKLVYLTNPVLETVSVTSYATGKPKTSVVYNMEKGAGRDPYELFLSGSEPILVIENQQATTDKELILFRDSFGSSLAPLMVPAYKKVTLVDIRYVNSAYLSKFITFHNQDVLFLYSAIVLNNSTSMK